jgi:hypothetical protein
MGGGERAENASQMEGVRPPLVAPPSIWAALVATPHVMERRTVGVQLGGGEEGMRRARSRGGVRGGALAAVVEASRPAEAAATKRRGPGRLLLRARDGEEEGVSDCV